MRYVSWIITLPLAAVAVSFAVSNRDSVSLTLWPLPFSLSAPLYLVTLIALVIGFVVGGVIAHASGAGRRRRARATARRAERLDHELSDWKARAEAAERRLAEKSAPAALLGTRSAA